MEHKYSDIRVPIEEDNVSICREESLCVKCGACKNICKFNVGVYDNYDINIVDKAICINCGQCSLVCPTESICEVKDYLKLKNLMKDDKKVVFQVAPAVRASLGEEFGMELGTNVEGKIVTALKKLGADYVFDTTFGADLTIMEEANELIYRIKNKKTMPMFTSCCPAWVKFVETFYPEFIPNLSSCKSPILMQGSIIKNYFANLNGIDREDIISVAVTPCTAKKYEIKREEFCNDVDFVITTRELANWIREENIEFNKLEDSNFDDIMGRGTGAGIIFGNSGGVMEAALRTANHILNGMESEVLQFEETRGLGNIKEALVKIGDYKLSIAVINGTGDAKKVLEKLKSGEVNYDFIEVMACEGGCIAGGGQPRVHFPVTGEVKIKRKDCLFNLDVDCKIRNSYDNSDIIRIYDEYLGMPLSDKSKELLHTSYVDRSKDLK